ncbi:MAG: hypothetical protein HYV09_08575 [Deltaproteobacteria bacterium]|nr:hypothetical protein [Deltaproteobacteria bacterium]
MGAVAVTSLVAAILAAGAYASAAPVTALAIPDRDQHPQSPPSGWCGETAIQEALLHFGAWVSQNRIHAAGQSKHPDLYSDDIPRALDALGVRYDVYSPKTAGKTKGFAAYEAWVRAAIDAGDPVLAGVKILPTEHPTWGLDHFVLAIGHGPKGLLVNTTWGRREWASDATSKGISFANAFYALRLRGTGPPEGSTWTARLSVLDESPTEVRLQVRCGVPGARVERRPGPNAKATSTDTLPKGETTVKLPAEESAYFRCLS